MGSFCVVHDYPLCCDFSVLTQITKQRYVQYIFPVSAIQALFGFDPQFEPQVTVHPINPIVIPGEASAMEPPHHLVKAPALVTFGQVSQAMQDGTVYRAFRLIPKSCPAIVQQTTGMASGQPIGFYRILN